MKAGTIFIAAALASTAFTAAASAQQAAPAAAPQPASAQAAEDARLLAYLDKAFDEIVATSPESLTSLGIKQDYGKLDDYTDANRLRQIERAEAQVAKMKAEFDYGKLSPAGQLSYRLFEQGVASNREDFAWRWYQFPISTNGSPAGDLPAFLINQHSIDSVADAEAYINRLKDVERVMGEISANVRYQADQGIVPPKMVFAPVRADAKKVIAGAPFDNGPDSTLLADFKKKVGALKIEDKEKARLIADASAALTGPFKRGYDTMFAALDAIEPKSKGNDGAWSLPKGDAYYANRLHYYTTTDLTAEQIHQIGLEEVARIEKEMEAIKAKVGFTGTLQQFFDHIRTDPKFKYPNTDAGREEYLSDARRYVAQAMAKAPEYFHRLPKAPLEVRAVEKWREDTASIAFYNQPSPDGSRPGIFYANLADMTQVLRPKMESTTYHEAAPGHHFQIARAQELAGIPKFRKFGYYGAYVEGWGLYSEQLAREMGFFQDPYNLFGHLSLELWRAVRLVTDTGLHAKKWTREQAIDYFRKNTLLSERDIEKEVNRYINNPGQATSYKIGQLKIVQLRAKAKAALGPKFDIRDFHEVVLGDGALPLDVLEAQVDAYIAAKKGA